MWRCLCIITFVVIKKVEGQQLSTSEVPTVEQMKLAASKFSEDLKRETNLITNYKKISKEFQNLASKAVYKEVNGEKINKNFSSSLMELFNTKNATLQKLKKKAQKYYRNDPALVVYPYKNIRQLDDSTNNSVLEIFPKFSLEVPVNFSYSSVQVPTNIYANKTSILNVAKRTNVLNEVFRDNEFNGTDPSLMYQYYGDSSGMFRVYPGNKNGYIPGEVDLFDCRRRVWYKRASASPKDVVIIIDTSGSMIGSNIEIAKITAKSLIDTFGENDYFNIILTNKSVSYISCIQYLIQATKVNKERMKHYINLITEPKETFNISEGLKEAFKIFESGSAFNRSYSAECNRIIMVISDSVEGDYTAAGKDVFDQFNKDKTVRVFSYLIGRVKNPDDRAMKEMSCNNRGYFYKIETLGNVWDTVLHYLEILSRPMVEALQEQKPQYSPVYLDSSGNGMIMSISLGVFNSRNITGVVGIDMLMRTLQQQVNKRELGSFSHEILVNNNGFVLIHPHFRDQTGHLPEPTNVYLDDLERSVNKNDSVDLVRMMLDRRTDKLTYPVYWLYNNNKRFTEINFTYFFSPVNNMEFSSGIVISDIDSTYYELKSVEKTWMSDGLNALFVHEPPINKSENYTQNNFTYVSIAPWVFCKDITAKLSSDTPRSLKVYPTAKELFEYLETVGTEVPPSCDEFLLRNLLVTASIVHKGVKDVWDNWRPKELELFPPYKAVYTSTSGGYSRYFTHWNSSFPYNRDVYQNPHYQDAQAMPWYEIIVSTHTDDKEYVNVAAPSWMKHDGKKVLGAVTGVKMNVQHLGLILFNATKEINLDCTDSMSIVCVVVDRNGYIVISNQDRSYDGQFLGEIQGSLVSHLANVNVSIFKKLVLYDTQGECAEPKVFDSAAYFLHTPAKLIIYSLKLLYRFIYFFLFHMTVLLMDLFTPSHVKSQKIETINVSCTKTMPFYTFQEESWQNEVERGKKPSRLEYKRMVECDKGKSLEWVLSNITGTNLIFIVAKQPDDTSCRKMRVSLKHIPLKTVDPNDDEFCKQAEHYRVKPNYCFNATTPDEGLSEYCGQAYLLNSSKLIIALLLSVFVYLFG